MLYNQPTGTAAGSPYVGKNIGAGIQGSKVPPMAIEGPQRELVNAIRGTGQTDTNGDLTQLLQALSRGIFVGTLGGTANALTASISGGVTMPALLTGMRFHALGGSVANTGPATLAFTSGFTAAPGTLAVLRSDGLVLQPGDIAPGAFVTFVFDGTALRFSGATSSQIVRTVLVANLNLYVSNATGSDTANTGLTSGSPFKTKQKAYDFLRQRFDLNGYTATVTVAPGTYAGFSASAPIVGAAGPASVQFIGDPATPGNVVVTGPIAATNAGMARIRGFKLTGAPCIGAGFGGRIEFGDVEFGASAGSHIACNNYGNAIAIGNYSISGGAFAHLGAIVGGQVDVSGAITVTVTNTPTFSSGFVSAAGNSIVSSSGVTWTGTAVFGNRYVVSSNSTIVTNGSGANYFPGNSAGVEQTNGKYI